MQTLLKNAHHTQQNLMNFYFIAEDISQENAQEF